jgi:toxin ParE1/3/4
MPFTVRLTDAAARDLTEIIDFIASNRGPDEVHHVLDRLEEALSGLTDSPMRGAYPRELLAVGVKEYREVFFKPYRIIYRVEEADVFVFLVADGRRDFRALLERRLLGA